MSLKSEARIMRSMFVCMSMILARSVAFVHGVAIAGSDACYIWVCCVLFLYFMCVVLWRDVCGQRVAANTREHGAESIY